MRPGARPGASPAGRRAADEEAHARLVAAEAGLSALADDALAKDPHPEVMRYLRQRHRQRARRWAAREAWSRGLDDPTARDIPSRRDGIVHDHATAAPSHEAGQLDQERAATYRRAREVMIHAEERAIRELRDRGQIGDDVMRAVQRDLDLELLLLRSPDPVREPPPEVTLEQGPEHEPEP